MGSLRPSRSSRFRLPAALVAVLAFALVAGGAAARTTGGGDDNRLTWAIPAQIRGLDYTRSADAVSASVISLGCETLVQYDRNGRLRPNLAVSFSTPNPTTYVYRLRPGVKFWDGAPLTVQDVLFSLQRAAEKTSNIASFYTSVRSMRATGRDRVTIRLKTPDPYFRYSPAVTYIVQRAFGQRNTKTLGTPDVLTMCTGPYRFTRFVPDESVELTRFEGYWGRKGRVRDITLRFIVSDATRLLAIRSGEIDGTFQVPQDQIDQWKRVQNVRVQLAPELRTGYISFDTAAKPWDDVHVRRAMAYALDRRGLVRAVLRGYGEPAVTMTPPEQWAGLIPDRAVRRLYATLPQYRFNLQRAKAELALSKYKDGFTAELPFPDSRQTLGKAALALSQNVKGLGITLNVKQVTTDDWFAKLYGDKKGIGAQIISWGVDYPDPADAPHFLYDSRYATANAFNTANYKSKEMDRYLRIQENSVNPGVRARAIANVQRVAAKDVAYLPIWHQQIAVAVSSKYSYRGFGTWYLYTPWAVNISPR